MSDRNEWYEHAACRKEPVELFFPPVEHEAHQAKALCAVCTVREPCLEFAIESGETFGIWGGMTSHERRLLVAARRRRTTSAAHRSAGSA